MFHDEGWYEYIEQLYKRGTEQSNSVYWYDVLQQSCSDRLGEGGESSLLRPVPPS